MRERLRRLAGNAFAGRSERLGESTSIQRAENGSMPGLPLPPSRQSGSLPVEVDAQTSALQPSANALAER